VVYEDDKHSVRIVDVGGKRSERKMWAHCFQDLNLVVEFVNLYGMHLPLYEDEDVLEVDESVLLASEIFGSKWMTDTKRVVIITGFELFERNFSSNQKLIEEKLGKI
jgi:guanine nucleotide-binding protein subunit alpha